MVAFQLSQLIRDVSLTVNVHTREDGKSRVSATCNVNGSDDSIHETVESFDRDSAILALSNILMVRLNEEIERQFPEQVKDAIKRKASVPDSLDSLLETLGAVAIPVPRKPRNSGTPGVDRPSNA